MDMGTRQYSLEEALIATDVCADGRAHDGHKEEHLTYTMADLIEEALKKKNQK